MKINRDTDTLLVVDVQNDFVSGSLAVPSAQEIIPIINKAIPKFGVVVYSRDAHKRDHPSFKAQGGPWPEHCVIDSLGYMLHKDFMFCAGDSPIIIVDKGLEEEAHSAFGGVIVAGPQSETIEDLLKVSGTKRLFICGLATDYCVKATVLDALKLFAGEVYVLVDAIRAVNIEENDGRKAIHEMKDTGAILVASDNLED